MSESSEQNKSAPKKSNESINSGNEFKGILLDLQSRLYISKLSSKITKLALISISALIASVCVNFYLSYKLANTTPVYFATFGGGRLIPMTPLSEPVASDADVVDFAQKGIRRSLTLSFLNYRAELQNARMFFTTDWFANFLGTLDQSGILQLVKKQRFNLSASTNEAAVITSQSIENGVMTYIIECPVTLVLAGQTTQKTPQTYLATITVQRVPTTIKQEGLAITQFITSPK